MEEGESAKILKVCDLIRRAHAVTGTNTLTSHSLTSLSKSEQSDGPPKLSKDSSQNPNCRILKSLSHPAVLVGTLSLPRYYSSNDNANVTIQCSCFQFTDGSATVCCDILDFCPEIVGKSIRACAWNFMPLKCASNFGGFLEIIKWECLECISDSSAYSLSLDSSIDYKDDLKAKHSIFGVLESVSPICTVPCWTPGGNSIGDFKSLSGFLSKVLVCECKLCRCKVSRMELHDLSSQNCRGHCFVKPLTVYFCGSASSWHPAISRLVRSVVSLSGLKKKLVYIGKRDSEVMYLTTDKASLQLAKLKQNWNPNEKVVQLRGLGEVGNYAGTVTGIYMQGMVVELDQDLFLLLTDQQLLLPHSLRVGAIVSVRNVHFINPKFSWTKAIILGACFMTTILVESFSPMEAGCYLKPQSHNQLQKFIGTLTFSARLWGLLAITCLRQKFAGILSEKEILGSKHSEGLAQRYITSCLTSSMYLLRNGVFVEYCKHGLCYCDNGEDYSCLKLVVPISFLISHSETTWLKMLLEWTRNFNIMDAVFQSTCISCCGRSYTKQIRRILYSEDIGIKLLGNVKVSSSSGRLQLSDATGSIDIFVIDILSNWNLNTIYEVDGFTVIMQGVPHKLYNLNLNLGESFTCRSIFGGAPSKQDTKLSLYLYYNFRDQKPRDDIHSPSTNGKQFQEPECGRFHLLRLEHKYSVLHELVGDEAMSNRSSVLAEAILLPWDLTITKKDEVTHLSSFPVNQPRNFTKSSIRDKQEEDMTIKKCKSVEILNNALDSERSVAGNVINCLPESTICSHSSEEKHCDLNSQSNFPCLISSRNFKVPYQGFLNCRGGKAITSSGFKADGRRVFLEFGAEIFFVYKGLRIGDYYIIQQDEKDMLCAIKDGNNKAHRTFFITSKTCFWSLSFSSYEVLSNSESSAVFPMGGSSAHDNEVLPDVCQHENSSLIYNDISPEIHSDIDLFVPADIISYFKVDVQVSHSDQMHASFQGGRNVHNDNGLFIAAPILFSGDFHSDNLLPEGDLISIHGHVLAVHDFNYDSLAAHPRSGNSGNSLEQRVPQDSGSICIHVLVGHNMARIFGAQGDYMLPTGFGDDIHATFHRVLLVGGENQYMLTPTSFIVVNSINGVTYLSKAKSSSSLASALKQSIASVIASPRALISDITKRMDVKPVQLCCRVVTLHVLILENRKALNPCSHSLLPGIDIPLAGFILDDGSSSCCCWANCERAATLLGLYSEVIPHKPCTETSRRSQTMAIEKVYGSTIGRLNKILRQHGRIIVKNYGSMFGSSGLDFTFSVGSDETLHSSDEDFIRCLTVNACLSTIWTIVGSLMNTSAISRLEEQLIEMGMAMLPVQHIWSTGVNHIDPLSQTRERIQGLVNN